MEQQSNQPVKKSMTEQLQELFDNLNKNSKELEQPKKLRKDVKKAVALKREDEREARKTKEKILINFLAINPKWFSKEPNSKNIQNLMEFMVAISSFTKIYIDFLEKKDFKNTSILKTMFTLTQLTAEATDLITGYKYYLDTYKEEYVTIKTAFSSKQVINEYADKSHSDIRLQLRAFIQSTAKDIFDRFLLFITEELRILSDRVNEIGDSKLISQVDLTIIGNIRKVDFYSKGKGNVKNNIKLAIQAFEEAVNNTMSLVYEHYYSKQPISQQKPSTNTTINEVAQIPVNEEKPFLMMEILGLDNSATFDKVTGAIEQKLKESIKDNTVTDLLIFLGKIKKNNFDKYMTNNEYRASIDKKIDEKMNPQSQATKQSTATRESRSSSIWDPSSASFSSSPLNTRSTRTAIIDKEPFLLMQILEISNDTDHVEAYIAQTRKYINYAEKVTTIKFNDKLTTVTTQVEENPISHANKLIEKIDKENLFSRAHNILKITKEVCGSEDNFQKYKIDEDYRNQIDERLQSDPEALEFLEVETKKLVTSANTVQI